MKMVNNNEINIVIYGGSTYTLNIGEEKKLYKCELFKTRPDEAMIPFLSIRYISENSVSIENLADKDQLAGNGELFCKIISCETKEDYRGIKLANGFSQLSKEEGVKVGIIGEFEHYYGGMDIFNVVIKKDGEDLLFEPFDLYGWISARFYIKPGEVITVTPNIDIGLGNESLLRIEIPDRFDPFDPSEMPEPPVYGPDIPDDIW